MRLLAYFGGHPIRLWTPFPPSLCASRINEAARSPFDPFARGVVGLVLFGHLRLRFRSGWLEYGAKPVLAGVVASAGSGSRLDLRYRAPASIYVGLALTVPIFGLMLWLSATDQHAGLHALDLWPVAMVVMLFFSMQYAWHRFGTRNSEAELDEILEFLEQTIRATRLGG